MSSRTIEDRLRDSEDGYVTVYRVGGIEGKDKRWLFFAFDLDYYKDSDISYKAEDAEEYLVDLSANIWSPFEETDLDAGYWNEIVGSTSEFERWGIADESDKPWLHEGLSVTSTDGLVLAAIKLRYQAVYFHGVTWSDDKEYDEIAVIDKSIIARV